MADRPQFWTPEFIEAFVEAMNEDPDFKKAARGFSDTIIFRCLDHPTGEDIEAAYQFSNGEVEGVELWQEDAPSHDLRNNPFEKGSAMARATAPYEVWVRLDKGEMTPLGALTSPDYHIEGPKLKIMSNMGVLNGMSTVSKQIDKTY
jgi:putative sterol carrier protein